MENFKKIAAVILTMPLWLPILAHLLVHCFITNHDKIEKEFEE